MIFWNRLDISADYGRLSQGDELALIRITPKLNWMSKNFLSSRLMGSNPSGVIEMNDLRNWKDELKQQIEVDCADYRLRMIRMIRMLVVVFVVAIMVGLASEPLFGFVRQWLGNN